MAFSTSVNSRYITIQGYKNDTPSQVTCTFQPPMRCYNDTEVNRSGGVREESSYKLWEVALARCSFHYLVFNITSRFDNNKFVYQIPATDTNPAEWITMTIPDGHYTLKVLNEFIQSDMYSKGHYIKMDPQNGIYKDSYALTLIPFLANGVTKIEIEEDYQVDFELGTVAKILGYNPSILESGTHYGSRSPSFYQGVTSFKIKLNILNTSSYNGDEISDAIYSFYPEVEPSTLINIEPAQRIYLPINPGDISNIQISLTDQRGVPIKLQSDIIFVLHLRKVSF